MVCGVGVGRFLKLVEYYCMCPSFLLGVFLSILTGQVHEPSRRNVSDVNYDFQTHFSDSIFNVH